MALVVSKKGVESTKRFTPQKVGSVGRSMFDPPGAREQARIDAVNRNMANLTARNQALQVQRAADRQASIARQASSGGGGGGGFGTGGGGLGGGRFSSSTVTTPIGPSPEIQSGMQTLVEQYNRQFDVAQSQNEQRFQDMLGIADATTQQRAADIRTGAGQEEADIFQRLARSGLGGSSVGTVQAGGVRRRKEESLDRLADTMQGTRLGIMEQMQPAFPDLGTLQSTLTGVSGQFEGGSGLQSLLQALGGIGNPENLKGPDKFAGRFRR